MHAPRRSQSSPPAFRRPSPHAFSNDPAVFIIAIGSPTADSVNVASGPLRQDDATTGWTLFSGTTRRGHHRAAFRAQSSSRRPAEHEREAVGDGLEAGPLG